MAIVLSGSRQAECDRVYRSGKPGNAVWRRNAATVSMPGVGDRGGRAITLRSWTHLYSYIDVQDLYTLNTRFPIQGARSRVVLQYDDAFSQAGPRFTLGFTGDRLPRPLGGLWMPRTIRLPPPRTPSRREAFPKKPPSLRPLVLPFLRFHAMWDVGVSDASSARSRSKQFGTRERTCVGQLLSRPRPLR